MEKQHLGIVYTQQVIFTHNILIGLSATAKPSWEVTSRSAFHEGVYDI